jgi:hypothetical protein
MQSGLNEILDKIAALAKQGTFSSIEKDLLLQYTRDLYEHILSTETTAVAARGQEPETAVNNVLPDMEDVTVPIGAATYFNAGSAQVDEPEPAVSTNTPDPAEAVTEPESEISVDEYASEKEKVPAQINTREPAEEESVISEVKENSDQPETAFNMALPETIEELSTQEEGSTAENASESEASDQEELPELSTNERPFQEPEDFELEPELRKEQVFDPKNLIDFRLWNRDIRSYIGINDKYNFISELFSNNAEAYEEILNEINGMESAEEARYFLENSGVTTLYKWQEDGFSEQIFYNVLNQFFAAK